MTTVTRMEMQFMMKVNRRYLAISGSTSEVGGRILETKSKNTTRERRMEMPRVTFSPGLGRAQAVILMNRDFKVSI